MAISLATIAETAVRRDAFNAIARADRSLEENAWLMAALHLERAAQKLRELHEIQKRQNQERAS
jgi:hypothetical protein